MAGPLTVVLGEPESACLDAIAAQRRPAGPPRPVASLAAALSAANDGWLWIVAGGAAPEPGALEALWAGTDSEARLLASLPVDASGSVHEPALPRGAEADTEGLIASVRRGMVPIRHAPVDSLLIEVAAARAAAPPDPARYGPLAARAWTARFLSGERGYLVPASRVRVPPPAPGMPRAVIRMARDGLYTKGEAVRALSSRPRR